MLTDVLTVPGAVSGFGSPVVILAVCMLLVGETLARTGVAAAVGDLILRRGGTGEVRLLVLVMLAAGMLGAFMSSTAVVAVFIPIILRIAGNTGLSASRLLLPMSYAALINGMLTLIATTPNIVVHEELKAEGFEGFGFFGFTAIGISVLAAAIVYIVLLGRQLLPRAGNDPATAKSGRQLFELWRAFNRTDDVCRARIEADSPLAGKAVGEAALETRYAVRIAGIETGHAGARSIMAPGSTSCFRTGDTMLMVGTESAIQGALDDLRLTREPPAEHVRRRWLWEIGGASVLMHPDSTLLGQTLRDAGEAGPRAMMSLLFFLTAALGLILSNTASAVLVAPIAIYAAGSMSVSPYPFAVAVLIAASSAYSTPVSTPVVTLVVDPGKYRFADFLKVGAPLLLITYGVTLLVAPLLFPF